MLPTGQGGGASHQRGNALPTPAGRLYGFIQTGAFYNLEAPHHNPRAKGASNLSPLRTFGPAGRQPSRPTGRVHNANKKKLPCGSRSMEINVYSWMPVPVMPSILLPVFLLLLQLRFQPAVLSLFILPP